MLGDGDAALEVVQDAFATALRKRRSFRGEGSVEAWLWRIVVNKTRDRLRARRPATILSGYDAEAVEAAEPDEEVRASLRLLPERQRLIVFLRHYGDLSYDQIGTALEISPGTVAASLNAAHAALRRRLGGGSPVNELDVILDQLVADAPLERADWNDVLARAGRGDRARLSIIALGVALLAVVIATPAFGVGGRLLDLITGGTPVAPSQLSDRDLRFLSAMVKGVPPSAIPPSKEAQLAAMGGTEIRQIAERDGRAYFVVDKRDGSHCFAAGDVGAADLFGAIICPRSPSFPSADQPILDISIFRGPTGAGPPTIWRLEGFAADGVASVGVIGADGNLAAVTPVVDNVYVAEGSALPSEPAKEIVALAADGARLYSECLLPGPDRAC